MKLAIISDIHSNLHALEAVKEAIDRIGADEVVCGLRVDDRTFLPDRRAEAEAAEEVGRFWRAFAEGAAFEREFDHAARDGASARDELGSANVTLGEPAFLVGDPDRRAARHADAGPEFAGSGQA